MTGTTATSSAAMLWAVFFLSAALVVAGGTVVERLSNDTRFDRFNALLDRFDGVRNILDNPFLSVTVLAPTDDAFDRLPSRVVALFAADTTGYIRNDLLVFHILLGTIPSQAIREDHLLVSIAGELLRVASDNRNGTADGSDGDPSIRISDSRAAVVEPDIFVDNGVVHVVDAVLDPGWFSVGTVDVLRRIGSFSVFLDLADFAGVADILRDDSVHTVLAPTDAAFQRLFRNRPELRSRILQRDYAVGFLRYHILPGVYHLDRLSSISTSLDSSIPNIDQARLQLSVHHSVNDDDSVRIENATITEEYFANNGYVNVVDTVLVPPSVTDVLLRDHRFDIFLALLRQVELEDTLFTASHITVFAPVDDAFAAVSVRLMERIRTQQYATHLRDLLLSHVVPNAVFPVDRIQNGDSFRTLATTELTVSVAIDPNRSATRIAVHSSSSNSSNNNNVDGHETAVILSSDIKAYNPGIVHAVSAVLMPTWVGSNLLTVANAHNNFTEILQLARSFPDVVFLLIADTPHTFFLPSDEALARLRAADPDPFDAILSSPSTVNDIVRSHIVRGVHTIHSLPQGPSNLTSVSNEQLTVVRTGDSVTVNGYALSTADVLADNGVLHGLDGLLLPNGYTIADFASSAAPSIQPSLPPSVSPKNSPSTAPTEHSPADTMSDDGRTGASNDIVLDIGSTAPTDSASAVPTSSPTVLRIAETSAPTDSFIPRSTSAERSAARDAVARRSIRMTIVGALLWLSVLSI